LGFSLAETALVASWFQAATPLPDSECDDIEFVDLEVGRRSLRGERKLVIFRLENYVYRHLSALLL
jgi:hypothetical protein